MSTILHRIARWADEAPSAPAQHFKVAGKWKSISAKELSDQVFHLALFLESRGFGAQDVGTILSYNCPQWVQMDLAPSLLGGLSAGLYPNANKHDVEFILEQTRAKVLSVQNRDYFKKVVDSEKGHELPPFVEVVICFEGDANFCPKAIRFEDALAEGRRLARGKSMLEYLDRLRPTAGAFLIYTSGTTGNPKGAILSHDNMVFVADMAINFWKVPMAQERMISFLPLCHVAEKVQNIAVGLSARCEIYFCSKFENVSVELPEVQPTILLCVPRVWEKLMEAAEYKISHAKGMQKRMAEWALDVGAKVARSKFSDGPLGLSDWVQYRIANPVVISKIRTAMGLGRLKYCASGAAALGSHVIQWFRSLGVDISEIFGQTESTAIITMNEPGIDGIGTVGRPVPGTEFKIADDGEILTRGRHVFNGYFKNPEATAETLKNGWLFTGDIGQLNEKGQLVIRGRKKEVLKTSGGKMIAPLPIEEKLKASPLISQVCMVGEGRKYLSALVTITEAAIRQFGVNADHTREISLNSENVKNAIKAVIESVNQELASFEQIKSFTVMSHEFSIETGEMTPTLKIKRAVIEKKYHEIIEKMYS